MFWQVGCVCFKGSAALATIGGQAPCSVGGSLRVWMGGDTNSKPSILLANPVCHSCSSKNMIHDRTRPGDGRLRITKVDSESVVEGGWSHALGTSSNDFRLCGPARPHLSPCLGTTLQSRAQSGMWGSMCKRCDGIPPVKTCSPKAPPSRSSAVDREALDRGGTKPPRVSPRRNPEGVETRGSAAPHRRFAERGPERLENHAVGERAPATCPACNLTHHSGSQNPHNSRSENGPLSANDCQTTVRSKGFHQAGGGHGRDEWPSIPNTTETRV